VRDAGTGERRQGWVAVLLSYNKQEGDFLKKAGKLAGKTIKVLFYGICSLKFYEIGPENQ
jgi:hypothetical protein